MKTFKLNIGTEIGNDHGFQSDIAPEGIKRIVADTFDKLAAETGITYELESKLSTGGDWDPELIIVVTLRVPLNDFEGLWFTLLDLVRTTGQDCIAIDGINHRDGGYLLFHPNYASTR